ncbi:hypothetical protein D3OALGA1CA_3624 [Olavius algarvensis associated proteobacterium Delta 3]|nr:hypothetical protein D3OALGA1CA_3624 [Olavius algarvensis associated proteobacterium Delta 3]
MRTLFFPFTFVSHSALEALNACFQPIHVLLPSALEIPGGMIQAERDGRLVLDRSAAGDDDAMGEVLRQFHDWATVHRGSEIAWLKSQADSVPFYDDTSISRIRSELISKGRGPTERDPLQKARIFLQMAQMYDAKISDLESELGSFEQLETALFQDLKGEPAAAGRSSPDIGIPQDPGAFMTVDRLNAWARLFLLEPPAPPDGPTVMVTTSRAVLEEVMEAVPQTQQVAFFERIPVTGPPGGGSDHQWRQSLGSYMVMLSHPDASPAAELPVAPGVGERVGSLSVYRIPGVPTDTVVERWITPDSAAPPGMPKETALLALMEVRNL